MIPYFQRRSSERLLRNRTSCCHVLCDPTGSRRSMKEKQALVVRLGMSA
jgi:hypothetical protein